MVPLTIRFGEEQLRDGVDIDAATFYRRLVSEPELPVTSQPNPEEFAEVYARLLRESDDSVVSIHIAQKWSGTVQSAHIAAQAHPGRVAAVDSGSVSVGAQFLIKAALADVAEGLDFATIVKNTEARRSRVRVWVLLDTLTYLQKGGRIGRAQAFLGGVLNVKPLLRLVDGEALPQARVRNVQQGVAKMVELLGAEGPLEAVAMMTSAEPAGAADARRLLTQAYPELQLSDGFLGPVVGTYAGPNAIGIAGFTAP